MVLRWCGRLRRAPGPTRSDGMAVGIMSLQRSQLCMVVVSSLLVALEPSVMALDKLRLMSHLVPKILCLRRQTGVRREARTETVSRLHLFRAGRGVATTFTLSATQVEQHFRLPQLLQEGWNFFRLGPFSRVGRLAPGAY